MKLDWEDYVTTDEEDNDCEDSTQTTPDTEGSPERTVKNEVEAIEVAKSAGKKAVVSPDLTGLKIQDPKG